jgi:hypothetical protein
VISDLDIYRAANLLNERQGADAVIEAARMIDRIRELSDREGRSRLEADQARDRCVAGAADREITLSGAAEAEGRSVVVGSIVPRPPFQPFLPDFRASRGN